MPFDHERLDVYQLALDFVVHAHELVAHLPRGRGHLADQLVRASTSIVLNIAEGAGKFGGPDKRRFFLIALGSTTECAAIYDVCLRLKVLSAARHREGKDMLDRVAAMLTKLAQRHERGEGGRKPGAGAGAGAGAGGVGKESGVGAERSRAD